MIDAINKLISEYEESLTPHQKIYRLTETNQIDFSIYMVKYFSFFYSHDIIQYIPYWNQDCIDKFNEYEYDDILDMVCWYAEEFRKKSFFMNNINHPSKLDDVKDDEEDLYIIRMKYWEDRNREAGTMADLIDTFKEVTAIASNNKNIFNDYTKKILEKELFPKEISIEGVSDIILDYTGGSNYSLGIYFILILVILFLVCYIVWNLVKCYPCEPCRHSLVKI